MFTEQTFMIGVPNIKIIFLTIGSEPRSSNTADRTDNGRKEISIISTK